MRIGVDFDNTIVCYDQVFHRIAVERGMISATVPATKAGVRDYLRRVDREDDWTQLQGYIYGPGMQEVAAYPGVLEFFRRCGQLQIPLSIISHKTRRPFRGPAYDLHLNARDWLDRHGFHTLTDVGLPREQVYLELTKERKLERIRQAGCTHFIDDLPEFLAEPAFPASVERILFDPNDAYLMNPGCRRAASWFEIADLILS